MKTWTILTSIIDIFPLHSIIIIQDQAAEVTSTGMSAHDLKEKLDSLKEIQQGKYKIVHLS